MFFKRFLVMLTGVLIFIGVFLLNFRLSDAHLEDVFKQERAKFNVQGLALTAPQPSFAVTTVTSSAPAPVAPAPSPTDSSAPTPPGASPDTNVIIGPVPPSSGASDMTPAPADNPAPAPSAPVDSSTPMVPAPDATPSPSIPLSPVPPPSTNNGPIAPPSSTSLEPRVARWFSLLIGATATETTPAAPTTNPPSFPAVSATVVESTPAISAPATPAPVVSTGTNAGSGTFTGTTATKTIVPPHAVSVGARAIILGYHQFTGPGIPSKNIYSMSQDVFESEMKYLKDNGYNVVPLSDVVRFIKHEIGLPPNAVAITIDDGYKSALNWAAPVLKKYNYPWTYFVYPAFITRTEGKGAASWPDLVELDKEGVDVESHSMTHPQLSRHRQLFTETPGAPGQPSVIKYGRAYHELTPQEYDDFLTNETLGAKELLEHELGKKIKYLAYPYGDYNKVVEAKAIAAGYEAIFTVADNPVHVTTDIYRVGRYIITKPVERAFAGYLRQGALGLAQVDPEPGATISNPQPVITAVLGFNGDPATIETSVRDFGIVRHDFDPATSTIRLYLPRALIQPTVLVSIHARDTQSGQTMVANWSFNYEPEAGAPAPVHQPIVPGEGESASMPATVTNAPATATPASSATSTPSTGAAKK